MTTLTHSPTSTGTQFVTSADGTRIAYECHGHGPALIVVDGAMCYRELGPAAGLAKALATDFTVYIYDRRSRGESDAGATAWSVEREIDDLAAMIAAAGGSAHIFAASSGAAISLEAARRGLPVARLTLYEAPFIVDGTHSPQPLDAPARLQDLVDRGERGGAVRLFLRMVGMPAPLIPLMRLMPPWRKMTGVAHTLPCDVSIVVPHQQGQPLPEGRYSGVEQPALVIAGGKSPDYMRNAQAHIAAVLPHARLQTLPGQTHMVKPKVVAPVITRFILGDGEVGPEPA
jgi:hypothetical protein